MENKDYLNPNEENQTEYTDSEDDVIEDSEDDNWPYWDDYWDEPTFEYLED